MLCNASMSIAFLAVRAPCSLNAGGVEMFHGSTPAAGSVELFDNYMVVSIILIVWLRLPNTSMHCVSGLCFVLLDHCSA